MAKARVRKEKKSWKYEAKEVKETGKAMQRQALINSNTATKTRRSRPTEAAWKKEGKIHAGARHQYNRGTDRVRAADAVLDHMTKLPPVNKDNPHNEAEDGGKRKRKK